MKIASLILTVVAKVHGDRDLSCDDVGTHTCDIKFNEVCGSDGNTYINFCVFEKARCFSDPSLQKIINGPCCLESCPTDVSGEASDNKYENDCVFWYHKCRHLMVRNFRCHPRTWFSSCPILGHGRPRPRTSSRVARARTIPQWPDNSFLTCKSFI